MNFNEFKKKILNTKTLLITFFPICVISINSYLRHLYGYSYLDGMGYSMSAIAIGAIYPFSIFEYILIGKVLQFKPTYKIIGTKVIATYSLEIIPNKKDTITNYIEKVRLSTYILCVFCTFLFFSSIVFDLKDLEIWSLLVGAINVFIVWLYLVFV